MYKLCKLYESVFERHTIACIVYLTLSFLMILLLLLMPHGLVNAASSGSSADTSVQIGDSSGSGSDTFWENFRFVEDDILYIKNGLYKSDINESFLNNNGISAIKLSDMIEVNRVLDESDSVSGLNTTGSNDWDVETINSYLDQIYLLDSSKFFQYPYYNYTIDTSNNDYIKIVVTNCDEQCYFSTTMGLYHWTEDSGNVPNGWPVFSKGEFISETIYLDTNNNSLEYSLMTNKAISQYFGFYYSLNSEDYTKFDGPFYYSDVGYKFWAINRVLASNMVYVDCYTDLTLKDFEDSLTTKNGFGGVNDSVDDDDLGDDSNHLYLDGANWNFNNVPKKFLSNNGNIYFSCIGLDDYQQNHLDNFYLNYDFKIECSVNYNTFLGFHSGGGGGHSFGTSAKNYKFSESMYQYYKDIGNYYSSFLPTQTNIRIPHKDTFVFYYKNPQDNTSFYRQTLEQFYNSGDKATFFTKNYLYDNCYGLARIDDDGSQYNCSFSNFIYSLDTLYDEWALENVTITCNAQIFDVEGGQGGNCKSSYNFVNGTENRIDTGMSINPNPYYGSGVDVATGTNANSTSNSSVINSGNINIENNPSIVINNDNSGKGSGDTNFIIQLVHGIFGIGSDENLDSIEPSNTGFFEWMGVNNWLSVINSAFSFIPVGFFQTLYLYFSVCIFILICAFVLKIIVEFL